MYFKIILAVVCVLWIWRLGWLWNRKRKGFSYIPDRPQVGGSRFFSLGDKMAKVKTFRINPEFGVPDKDIREFLNICEQDAIVNVAMCYIPALGNADPRLTLVVTKLDDSNRGEKE